MKHLILTEAQVVYNGHGTLPPPLLHKLDEYLWGNTTPPSTRSLCTCTGSITTTPVLFMMEVWRRMGGSRRLCTGRSRSIRRSWPSTTETVTPKYVRWTVMRLWPTAWWCRSAENFLITGSPWDGSCRPLCWHRRASRSTMSTTTSFAIRMRYWLSYYNKDTYETDTSMGFLDLNKAK